MAGNSISRDSTRWLGVATDVVAVTPHATNEINGTRGFMVNVAGNIACRPTDSGADVTLSVLAGVIYPISIKAVRVSGTTATGIFALY